MSDINIEEEKLDLQIRSVMENAEEPVPEHVWTAISDRLDAAERLKAAPIIPIWLRRAAIGLAAAAAIALGVFLFVPRHAASEDERIAVVTPSQPSTNQSQSATTPSQPSTNQSQPATNPALPSTSQSQPATTPSQTSTNQSQPATNPALPSTSQSQPATGLNRPDASAQENISDNNSAEESETQDEAAESAFASASAYLADALDNGNEKFSAMAESESSELTLSGATEQESRATDAEQWSDPFSDEIPASARGKVRTAITMSGNALSNAGSSSSSSQSGIHRQMVSSIVQQTTEGLVENSESSYGIPVSFGVGVKIIFTPRWSLGVGVNYSLLTRTFSGVYTSRVADTDSYVSTNYSKIRHSLNYIGIPIDAYFSIVRSHIVDFYAYAGGTVEKAVSNRYTLENDGIFKDPVKGLQFSADIGIGVEFIIADMVGIYIDPSLRYYFPNSTQPTSIRVQEPLNFGFEIGFRIRL